MVVFNLRYIRFMRGILVVFKYVVVVKWKMELIDWVWFIEIKLVMMCGI